MTYEELLTGIECNIGSERKHDSVLGRIKDIAEFLYIDTGAGRLQSAILHDIMNKLHCSCENNLCGEMLDSILCRCKREEETGVELTLSNCVGADLISLEITGNTEQKQYDGVNLCENNNVVFPNTQSNTTIDKNDETYTVSSSGESSYPYWHIKTVKVSDLSDINKILYTESGTGNCGIRLIQRFYGGYNIITVTNGTFTKPTDNNDIRVEIGCSPSDSINKTFSNIMIVSESNADHDYEPYVGGIPSPNPNYPQEIKNVGTRITEGEHAGKYAVSATVRGKNLLNEINLYPIHTPIPHSICMNTGESITISFTEMTYTAYRIMIYGTYADGTDFNVEIGSPFNNGYIGTTGRWQNSYNITSLEQTITCTKDCIITSVAFWNSNNETGKYFVRCQFELGTTATDYEQYHEPVTKTFYLNEPLREGDTLDAVSGTITRKKAVKVFDGTETVSKATGNNEIPIFYFNIPLESVKEGVTECLSSRFVYFPTINSFSDYGQCSAYRISPYYSRLYFSYNAQTAEDFKSYLAAQYAAGTPVIIEYELAEPTTEIIGGQNIPTFEDTTIITVDTETQPQAITAAYYAEVNEDE